VTDSSQSKPRGEPPGEEIIQQWIKASKAGNENAFKHLVETFASRLQAILYRMLLNWDDARDVTQETFVQIWRSLPRYEPRGKFQSWLFQIGTRKALDLLRKRNRRPESSMDDPDHVSTTGEKGVVDFVIARNETMVAIEQAVEKLTIEQRTAFILAEFEGCSHEEIAETMETSVKSVEMHLYRARQNLREKLKAYL